MDSFFDQWVVKDDGALNILLVEDNPNDEFLFREAVNGITDKHHIYVVKNGGEAIQFEKKTATPLRFIPNIVFLDLNLPELHGFDVLQSFKKKHVWNDVPVVILTSSLNNVDIERAYQLNAASFIRKCFDFKTFQDQIRQTIQYWANVARLPQANIPPSIS